MNQPQFLTKHAHMLSLVFITMIGLFLRVYGLNQQSLWYDELFSFDKAHPGKTWLEVWNSVHTDNHPPFYYLLLHAFFKVFGFTATSGRLLSTIAGTLAIPATYFLGRLVRGPKLGLLLASIAATNYFLVYYAQEARFYSLLYLFTVCLLASFITWLRKPNAPHTAVVVVFALLTAYTHYFGLFFLAAIGLFFLFLQSVARFRKQVLWHYGVVAALVFAIGYIPIIGDLIRNTQYVSGWIPRPNADTFFDYVRAFVGYNIQLKQAFYFFGLTVGAFLLFAQLPQSITARFYAFQKRPWLAALLLLILFFALELASSALEKNWPQLPFTLFAGAWLALAVLATVAWRSRPQTHGAPFTILLATCVVIVCYGIPFVRSILQTPMLQSRYEIVLLPVLFLVVGQGIMLWRSRWLVWAMIVFFTVWGTQHIVLDRQYYTLPIKEQWQSVAETVRKETDAFRQQSYVILAHPDEAPMWPVALELAGMKHAVGNTCSDTIANRYVWLLHTNNGSFTEDCAQHLQKNYKLLRIFNFHKASAHLYESVAP
jgi:uncharacterized membrane protein